MKSTSPSLSIGAEFRILACAFEWSRPLAGVPHWLAPMGTALVLEQPSASAPELGILMDGQRWALEQVDMPAFDWLCRQRLFMVVGSRSLKRQC